MKQKNVPKKNISTILVDVKKPDYNYENINRFSAVNLTHVPQAPKKSMFVRKTVAGTIFLFCATALLWTITIVSNMNEIKTAFAYGAESIVENFSSSVEALREFRPYDAVAFLKKNDRDIAALSGVLEKSYGDVVLRALGAVIPSFKKAATLLSEIRTLNGNFTELTEEIGNLQSSGMRNFQSDGDAFLRSITSIRGKISDISRRIEIIRNDFSAVSGISSRFDAYEERVSEEYLKYSGQLHELDAFLGGVLGLLGSENDRHVLVLFQNAAEVRPGGGFVGSYADVVIRKGQLQSIDVRDVYDPDGQLDLKVVPPHEIKTMSTDWGARDANWFFDFPTSARTILYFLENSKMYSEKEVVFDAVVGLNINVLESILSVIGPVPMEEYGVVISEDNFLKEIQREVETGDDKRAGEPKRILKVLAPIILERLGGLSESQSRILMERVSEHFSGKDVMIYAKDQNVSNFIASVGAGGEVYQLPNSFWGSYVAAVNANIAGGKSDVFVKQTIEARIDVDSGGSVFSDVGISRAHTGDKEKDPWWRATNKNFIQLYTTPGSTLVSVKGNDVKNLVSRFDYDAEGYERYPDLEKIEKTKIYQTAYQTWAMQAFGKTAFGTWFNVPAGQEKTLSIRYHTPATNDLNVSKGNVFTFIFEKQSGVPTGIKATISAPLGYIWEESRSPFYVYEETDAPSRAIVKLTLGK